MEQRRRASDLQGFARITCWCAARASDTWDWIDKRHIVERFVALAILYGTIDIIGWAKHFAAVHISAEVDGTEIALVIASVAAPYMALQAAAIAFMFRARA